VAKEVLSGIVDLLSPDDSLALVLFSDGACVPKPLGPVRCADVEGLKRKVLVGRGWGLGGAAVGSGACGGGGGGCRSAPPEKQPWAEVETPAPPPSICICPTPRPARQIAADVIDTSGTNFQAGIDAGGWPCCGFQPLCSRPIARLHEPAAAATDICRQHSQRRSCPLPSIAQAARS
jgi:hypothetical protein